MTDDRGDALAAACACHPSDPAARAALTDHLRERGYVAAADALAGMSDETAHNCFCNVWAAANDMRVRPALWVAVYQVMFYRHCVQRQDDERRSRETDVRRVEEYADQDPAPLRTVPPGRPVTTGW